MPTPLHPLIVHFPIALTFILPILILVFAFMIKTQKMSHLAWLVIIGLQVATTATGYIALETGENEEHAVEKVLDKKLIQAHEESAEIFVGFTVLALVLSVGSYFLRTELQFLAQLVICAVTLVSGYLAYNTGSLGGELVYRHGAAQAYTNNETSLDEVPQGLLPTPGMNTSESPMPVENESLKRDENDYGTAGEAYTEEE
jgi:uncharacterized membrane protein